MKNGTCFIVCAGENYGLDFVPGAADFVIAADAGYCYLQQAGIRCDRVIGDFDTLGARPDHPDVVTLCPEKDDTDTIAAVKEGMKEGYSRFALYCGLGGRIEHTIANLQLTADLSARGCEVSLHGDRCVLTAVTNGSIALPACKKSFVSVFSASDRAKGVTIRGLKYELSGAELTNRYPIGVSNEFVGRPAEIAVAEGTLIVVLPKPLPLIEE